MKLGRLNHIGVATPDLDASIAFYRDVMGATDITEPFVLESQQVRVCFVNTPGEDGTAGTQIELLQPTTPDSAVGKWLEKNPLGASTTSATKCRTFTRPRRGSKALASACWVSRAWARTGR